MGTYKANHLAPGERDVEFPGFRIGYWQRGHECWCTVLIWDEANLQHNWRERSRHIRGDFFEQALVVAARGLEECKAWFDTMEAMYWVD